MDELTALDRLLFRLLHDRDARAALRSGSLALSPSQRAAVTGLDLEELERVAASVRDDVLGRAHRGCGGLRDMYPRTLSAWTAAHPEDAALHGLAEDFLASEAWQAHRGLPFGERGTSLEEAFFRFASAREIGDPAVREAEFLGAIVRALAVSPQPSFTVPAEVRRVPGGHAAVSNGTSPVLHASVHGRWVSGTVTPFVAELVRGRMAPDAAARAHGVSADVLAATWRELGSLGLV